MSFAIVMEHIDYDSNTEIHTYKIKTKEHLFSGMRLDFDAYQQSKNSLRGLIYLLLEYVRPEIARFGYLKVSDLMKEIANLSDLEMKPVVYKHILKWNGIVDKSTGEVLSLSNKERTFEELSRIYEKLAFGLVRWGFDLTQFNVEHNKKAEALAAIKRERKNKMKKYLKMQFGGIK